MKLVIRSKTVSRTCEWASYALLRDNVQHYIERGEPDGRFSTLHSIARAVDGGRCDADPRRLREEVLRAVSALRSVPLATAAMSTRTRAILAGSEHVPHVGRTSEARLLGWALPVPGMPSDSVPFAAEGFINAVVVTTSGAASGDVLQVVQLVEATQ
jgi:hypothetical protein